MAQQLGQLKSLILSEYKTFVKKLVFLLAVLKISLFVIRIEIAVKVTHFCPFVTPNQNCINLIIKLRLCKFR